MADTTKEQVLRAILEFSEAWPDIVALWSGMVKQLVDDGWSDSAARALVLSSVTADNAALLCILPDAIDEDYEDGEDQPGQNL